MHGRIHALVALASNAAVGDTLLDRRPALVFSADGSGVLFGNAAAMALFGQPSLGALVADPISSLNPLRAQIARLARTLPSDGFRIEMLRLGQGAGIATVPAACRRLNFSDGTRAVLAIVAANEGERSITARAEALVDALAGGGSLAAVMTEDGQVVAGAGDFTALAYAEQAVDDIVEAARAGDAQPVVRTIALQRGSAVAGALRFAADGRKFTLLMVDTQEKVAAAPRPATPVPVARTEPPAPPVVAEAAAPAAKVITRTGDEEPDDAIEAAIESEAAPAEPPLSPPAVTARFLWQTDPLSTFTFVSEDLAEAVGARDAAIVGHTYAAVAAALGFDAEGAVSRALAERHAFSTTLRWPTAEGDCLAVTLTGNPDQIDGSFRGFGIIHLDQRSPDDRADRAVLPAPAIPSATNAPELGGEAEAQVLPAEAVELPAERPTPLLRAVPSSPTPGPLRDEPGDLDRVAQESIERGERPPSRVGARTAARPTIVTDNTLSPPEPLSLESLTGSERDAFRRIAEVLAPRRAPPLEPQRVTTDPPPPERVAETPNGIDVTLLDRLPIAIALFRDRKTLFANRSLLELLGYASFDAFIAAGGAEAIFPDRASQSGVAEAGDRVIARRASGETLPVKAWLHAVSFGGQTTLMLSLADLSGLKGDEDELTAALGRSQARAEELEGILDTATDGVLVIDGRGRIGRMNRAAQALFGVSGDEYIGRYFTDLFADESQKQALDYLDGLAANGVASVLNDGREVIGRVPQGGLIPLFMTMGRIGASDKFCAVLSDITHWKNVESELIAARRAAEAANLQKSEFLAKVSHEIRTPLNAIIGFSEVMMSERFGPIGNARYRDYLHDINVSGGHLMSLINDLLDLSKVEAGKLELTFESVALNAAVQECVALMQPQANRERIIIRTSLTADLPNVVADERSLRQILLNLMSNAVKFTRAGGQVIVSTAMEENGQVVLRIRDTGIGMSEKDIETALKPFRQVATARKDRDNGTGLGLPLTKALVEANRAAFAIESAVDQGTLVKITFPTTRVLAS